MGKKQKTSKYYLSSSNQNKKRLANYTNFNTYPSSTFEPKDDTSNKKSVADSENPPPPLVEEDDGPADHDGKKSGDLDLVPLKGARVKRHSTQKQTHHNEEVDVDFYDNDEEDAHQNEF